MKLNVITVTIDRDGWDSMNDDSLDVLCATISERVETAIASIAAEFGINLETEE